MILSIESNVISVLLTNCTLIPSGIKISTGFENPALTTNVLSPLRAKRYPTPNISKLFEKPSVTPSIKFFILEFVVPWIAFRLAFSHSSVICPSSIFTTIPLVTVVDSSPLGPLTVTRLSSRFTVTFSGITSFLLPIRLRYPPL